MSLAAQQSLAHYVILDPLGAGAMGEVWRARDTRLDRDVAIKVLPDHFAQDDERLRRFEREAKSLASLNHPNIAQIYGVDQHGETIFLALELVPGETLEERLRTGPLPVDEALDVCRQIAEALEAAHEAGVIHRDLKPANVRITPGGVVKVLDFGLAKPMKSASASSSTDSVLSTEQGRLIGTPTYMAPEQARGRSIDRRVDLWAFGCVIFECLTATRAFEGESLSDVLASVLAKEPDWTRLPAATPPRVRELLERCLCKDLAHRQRGAGDAALELESARATLGTQSQSQSQSPARASVLPWAVASLAIAAAAWGWLRHAKVDAVPPSVARSVHFEYALPHGVRLSPSDRMMNELAIAPDGSKIVYTVEENAMTAVFLRALDEPDSRRLELGKNVRGPTFSPDGAWLAYVENFDTFMKVPVAGGPPERIGKFPRAQGQLAWLADGTMVYGSLGHRKLHEIDIARGTIRTVCELEQQLMGFENVVASPDPGWLLVDGWKGTSVSDYRIQAFDRASGRLEVLLENAANPAVIGQDILVFQRGAALFAVKFDFFARRALGEPRLILSGVSTDRWGGSSQFSVSLEGTLVMAPGKRRGEGRRVVWTSPDGTVEPISVEEDAFSSNIDLARDGNSLVASTLRDHEELWAIDLVGHGMSRLVVGELNGAAIVPGGGGVVYSVNLEGGAVLRRATSGGATSTLLEPGKFDPTSISTDGRYVLLCGNLDPADQDQLDILVLDTARESPRAEPWLATPDQEMDAHFSPDEKWVAYVSDRSGSFEVFVRAWPNGKRDWKVSSGSGASTRWSSDGRTLYYLDEVRLMAVDFASTAESGELVAKTGPAREVFTNHGFAESQEYGVGPDGRIAMIQLADWELAESRLQVIVGWKAEIERALNAKR